MMRHTPTPPSAPGTPLADQKVSEIVAREPNLSRVFQTFDLGFCCQGELTLREACQRKSIDPDKVVSAIENERNREGSPEVPTNPEELSLSDLADFIVDYHHGFLRRELPRIHRMAERVADVHGSHTPSLITLFQTFSHMAQELAQHALKEEQILFPAIREFESSGSASIPLEDPISCMMDDHRATESALTQIRELTNTFQPPEHACNTYRALFAGLAEFDQFTQNHIHLEDKILFPRATKPPK